MQTVNWGVIGTGDVMEVKSGPGLYKAKGSSLVAVYNRTRQKAEGYAARHGIAKVCNSADELIYSEDVHIVYIATPPNSHKDYAVRVLQAGKIPYVEKPLSMTYAEALAIKQAADKAQLPVYVAFYRRGLDKFIKIKQLLDSKALGELRYVNIEQTAPISSAFLDKQNLPWRVKPDIAGGGLFMDIGSHVLDCLMFFFGALNNMQGYALNSGGFYDAEDTVIASFDFANGIVGSGQWCFVADEHKNQVTIVGDKGRLIYDGLSATDFKLVIDDKPQHFEFEQPEHIAMPYQQMVINEILGMGKSHANFDHAVILTKMMSGILAENRHTS